MKLYVGNLSFKMTEDELGRVFSEFGSVNSARIIKDRETDRSRGFGFVELSSKSSGDAAISALHGKEVSGRTLVVNEARPQQPRR